MPIAVKGKTIVAWGRENWFTMVTKLVFPDSDREDISFQYRGRLDAGERQYTFVLQHSVLGRVEGEGWVTPESIVQRYWVLGDKQRRMALRQGTGLMKTHTTYQVALWQVTISRAQWRQL